MKISKRIPICKPQKIETNLSSYRPINILNSYEKIIQKWIKKNLEKYLSEIKLIIPNHHGGIQKHSTLSAMTVINHHCKKLKDQNKFGLVLSSDLSSAYDTVDKETILNKMEYYGIVKEELEIFKSILTERTEFVEINNKRSSLLESNPCSIIQGSVISSLLYILYTNEVPLLHELLKDEEWINKNLEEDVTKIDDIEHTTDNFIDDSNSVIEFNDPTDANFYLDRFLKVLKIYYNDNKLQINTDKTSLLVISKQKHNHIKEEIRIEDDTEVV